MSEQKRLDRPELREKIDGIISDFGAEVHVQSSDNYPRLREEATAEILALFPDIEEVLRQRDRQWEEEVKRLFDRGYQKCLEDNLGFAEKAKKEMVTVSLANLLLEAKKQERERIFGVFNKRNLYILTKDGLVPSEEDWQALKEEK